MTTGTWFISQKFSSVISVVLAEKLNREQIVNEYQKICFIGLLSVKVPIYESDRS